jgi:hypothetical protein
MGQTIEVESVVLGEVALFDTDRTMTGQDGRAFGSVAAAQGETTTSARLAVALFAGDAAIDHVFVLSNQVTVRRTGGWSDEVVGRSAEIIRNFFIFYEENRGGLTE